MSPNVKTDVLIVGAGPTGLALAIQLIRYDIDFIIIDKREGITPYSKAIGVQARTLEIYQQINLAERLVDQGLIAKGVRLLEGGEARAEVPLSTLGEGKSPYPFLLIVNRANTSICFTNLSKRMAMTCAGKRRLLTFRRMKRG